VREQSTVTVGDAATDVGDGMADRRDGLRSSCDRRRDRRDRSLRWPRAGIAATISITYARSKINCAADRKSPPLASFYLCRANDRKEVLQQKAYPRGNGAPRMRPKHAPTERKFYPL
jgi:hypothetical protein